MGRFEDLSFNEIQNVINSWEHMKHTSKDYDIEAGTILFSHLFAICPSSALLFGFPVDMDTSREALKSTKRFTTHAKYMVEMLDKALNLLGPDHELLTEIMADLGKKHAHLGVTDETYYPVMGDALIITLKELLGPEFTSEVEESWREVYNALSGAMVDELFAEKASVDEQ